EELAATTGAARASRQRLLPVIDSEGQLVGVLTRADIDETPGIEDTPLAEKIRREPIFAFNDETLRAVAHRMAESKRTTLPVLDRDTRAVVGLVTLRDLLGARAKEL